MLVYFPMTVNIQIKFSMSAQNNLYEESCDNRDNDQYKNDSRPYTTIF